MVAGKNKPLAFAVALGAMLAAPLAFAVTSSPAEPRTQAQEQIETRLDRFERSAADLQKQLDHYAALTRTNAPERQSHARELNNAREHVNSLGLELGELEALSREGTDLQQAAIREARTHLEAVADHTRNAIQLLNDDKTGHRTADFREQVNGMQQHADDLYTKVDAITDHEKARHRAEGMNPPDQS
jgi:chromosome segregation ATPase